MVSQSTFRGASGPTSDFPIEMVSTAVQERKHFNAFGPYRLGRTIGQGEFGKVKLGYHMQSGKEV
jgi:serine/threonine protein kinase